MSDSVFNTMISEVDSFSYEQCVILLSKLSQIFQNKQQKVMGENNSPIDTFFGSVEGEDSEKMLTAVKDCRRIEPDEW